MGGLDVWCAAEDNLFPELCNADRAGNLLRSRANSGWNGVKSGGGFYDYREEEPGESEELFRQKLIEQLLAEKEMEALEED